MKYYIGYFGAMYNDGYFCNEYIDKRKYKLRVDLDYSVIKEWEDGASEIWSNIKISKDEVKLFMNSWALTTPWKPKKKIIG